MRKADIECPGYYTARISGRVVVIHLEREHELGGWHAVNLSTGRTVRIKTAGKLRFKASQNQINTARAGTAF